MYLSDQEKQHSTTEQQNHTKLYIKVMPNSGFNSMTPNFEEENAKDRQTTATEENTI